LAVNLGDDVDTTGAVYGQLAGAFYGLSGIPEPWISKLAKKDLILVSLLKSFSCRVHRVEQDNSWNVRTDGHQGSL